jgi:hypothetical protein
MSWFTGKLNCPLLGKCLAVRQDILWFSVRVLGALGVMRLSVGWFGDLRSEDHRV